ncbi:MAG: cysteine synthase A [Clostridia bacterium]|nr:cysteine synthase A [Clostridia bacterium]
MIYNNVLEAIGHTPIIRLNKMVEKGSAEILVKFEGLNVGGSIKTRTAFNMITDAERKGIIDKDTIIVEPTSGNQGIGLALVGAVKGYKTIIIMPDSVSEERRKLVRHYGAEVILVHDDGNIGDCIDKCLKMALSMAKENPKVYVPQQFENPANPTVHRHHTGLEILEQVAGPIHGFCSGIGTGGTLTGVGRYLKEQNPNVKIIGVEPADSPVLTGGKAGPHGLQGIGAGFVPNTLDTTVYDQVVTVTTREAFAAAKAFAASEGVLCGISSGAALHAAVQVAFAPENQGKTIVVLLPDTGERYLSTGLFE